MKWIKYIAHPHAYIAFFIIVSILACFPNALGWRGDMLGYTQNYIGLYVLYVLAYFLGYYFQRNIKIPEKREVGYRDVQFFQFIYIICFTFFILKFIYISGVPLLSDSPYLRVRLSSLGGFVDYPTKAMALLGIASYYIYEIKKNKLYLFQFFVSILLNILFAERSLMVFTIVGAIVIYVNYNSIKKKTFFKILLAGLTLLFLIGWVQILRHGGKDHLDLSGKRSVLQVVTAVVHGDLTGSQKFGAYVTDQLDGERLNGKYTLGIYLSLFIPNYKDHGATYLQKNYTKSKTAQSAAIPFSYFMDFGYWGLIFPFFIGWISKVLYLKFVSLNSPFFIVLYTAYFFNLLWSVRAGNFPIDPKLIYFSLVLIFVFNPKSSYRSNNEFIQMLRVLFLLTIVVSFMALIVRW